MFNSLRKMLRKIYYIEISETTYIDNYDIDNRRLFFYLFLPSLITFIVSTIFCVMISMLWVFPVLCSAIIIETILIGKLWIYDDYIFRRATKNGKHLSKEKIQRIIERIIEEFPDSCDINYINEKYNLSELT